MQINNNYSPNFGRMKIHKGAEKALNQLNPYSEVFPALERAGEMLSGTKHFHLVIDKDLEPIITTPQKESFYGITLLKPKDAVLKFRATNISHSKYTISKPGKIVTRTLNTASCSDALEFYRELKSLSPIARAAKMTEYMETEYKNCRHVSAYHACKNLISAKHESFNQRISNLLSKYEKKTGEINAS